MPEYATWAHRRISHKSLAAEWIAPRQSMHSTHTDPHDPTKCYKVSKYLVFREWYVECSYRDALELHQVELEENVVLHYRCPKILKKKKKKKKLNPNEKSFFSAVTVREEKRTSDQRSGWRSWFGSQPIVINAEWPSKKNINKIIFNFVWTWYLAKYEFASNPHP